jgi:hypothetical protein
MPDERRSQSVFSVTGVIVSSSAWRRRETDMNEVMRSGLLLVAGLTVTAAGILVLFYG